MNEAIVHIIRAPTLEFCTKQNFCPDFHSLHVESYGEQIETPANSPEEFHGTRLLPKLNWIEIFVFNALLIHLAFVFMAGILYYLDDTDDFPKAIVSVLCSGLISPTVTELITFTYRFVIKQNYNSSCSPMKVESNKSSYIWSMFRVFYLLNIFLLTILLSLLAIVLIEEIEDINFKFSTDSVERDTEILILLFVFTLIIIYTIWLIIFAIIRFLFRFIFFKPKTVIIDTEAQMKQDYSNSDISQEASVRSPQSPSGKQSLIEKSERSESLKSGPKSKLKSESKKGSKASDSVSSTEEKNYSEMAKTNELNTGSVIVKPTKDLGYIDPKVFKLSESQLDIQTKPKNKKN